MSKETSGAKLPPTTRIAISELREVEGWSEKELAYRLTMFYRQVTVLSHPEGTMIQLEELCGAEYLVEEFSRMYGNLSETEKT